MHTSQDSEAKKKKKDRSTWYQDKPSNSQGPGLSAFRASPPIDLKKEREKENNDIYCNTKYQTLNENEKTPLLSQFRTFEQLAPCTVPSKI